MRVKVEAVGGSTSLADRKHRAGQRIMLGFLGSAVDSDLRALLAEIKPMGIVLLARNLVEPEQVLELCRELSSLSPPHDPMLIALDCEGGRIRRLPAPAVAWPSARATARAQEGQTGRMELTKAVYRAMADELSVFGIPLALGPVADVDASADAGIGDRSFGADPEEVGRHVVAALEGQRAGAVIGCVKHFPGLGAAPADTHRALPAIERDIPELMAVDLAPFRAAVRAGAEMVMVGHAIYPAWDEDRPASLSARIVPEVLRERLGFRGLVLSDDLEMGALSRFSIEERADGANRAKIDVLMSCDDREIQYALFRALVLAQEDDPAIERTSLDAVRRVQQLRERALLVDRPSLGLDTLGNPEHRLLAATIRARGE